MKQRHDADGGRRVPRLIRQAALVAAALAALDATPALALDPCGEYYRHPLPDHRAWVDEDIDAAAVKFAARQFERGREILEKELGKQSDHSDAQFWLYDAIGSSYLMQGRPADAAAVFAKSGALPRLNVRGRYEAGRKLVYAHARAGNHQGVIDSLAQMAAGVCAPLSGKLSYLLAMAHFGLQRLPEAEEALVRAHTRDGGYVPLRDVRSLDFRIQCAQGRVRQCVERFMQQQRDKELTAVDAGWFTRLLPVLEKNGRAKDLLAQARSHGWIDAKNQAVPVADGESPDSDEGLTPILRIPPEYPITAASAHVQGSVLLSVTVGPDGNVLWVGVLESNPPGIFDEASLEAVSKWKFKPALADGVPVESTGEQRIDYTLERN